MTGIVAVSAALFGCTPIHGVHSHATSTPGSSFDVAALAPGSVATLGVVSPAGLQGFDPVLSQSLSAAVAEAYPSVQVIPNRETVNVLNERRVAPDYTELISGFERSGILERERLERVGSALRSRYLLLPGLASINEIMVDRFEISGLKVVQSRITTLRLWLQIWDAQTGRMLWESAGESSVASALLRPGRTVPLDHIARKLWLRMLRDGGASRRFP